MAGHAGGVPVMAYRCGHWRGVKVLGILSPEGLVEAEEAYALRQAQFQKLEPGVIGSFWRRDGRWQQP